MSNDIASLFKSLPVISVLKEQIETLRVDFAIIQQSLRPLNLTKWQIARLLAAKAWRDMGPLVCCGIVVLVAVTVLVAADELIWQPYAAPRKLRRLGIPYVKRLKGKAMYDYKPTLDDGQRKYPHHPWFFQYSGWQMVVYPAKCAEEIRRLPAHTASLLDFMTHIMVGGWRDLVGHETDTYTLHKTLTTDLSRCLGPLGPLRQKAALRTWENGVGPCREWKTVTLMWLVFDVVTVTGSQGIVGEQLSRNRRWIWAIKAHILGVSFGLLTTNAFPRLLQPVVASLTYVPAYMLNWYMGYLLRPVVDQAMKEVREKKLNKDDPKRLSLLFLLIDRYRPEEFTRQHLIKDIIRATFAGTPSTGANLYWIIIELLLRPELYEELRQEVQSVVKADGQLPATLLTELPKMDSFMRESMRVNEFLYLVLNRLLKEDMQLSIGPKLPKGTMICVDQHHVHKSATLYENPEVFDAYRFLRMRQKPGNEARYQLVNTGSDFLAWGDGSQACPGRFFAGNTLKIALAQLLLNYDIKLPAGASKPFRTAFPNGSSSTSLSFQFLIRERRL